jgi:hypothetical protein
VADDHWATGVAPPAARQGTFRAPDSVNEFENSVLQPEMEQISVTRSCPVKHPLPLVLCRCGVPLPAGLALICRTLSIPRFER